MHPRHLPDGPAVICDIALPGDVAPEVATERPDILLVEGGVVRLPRNRDFKIAGLPLPPGSAYACIAETLLMGLEDERGHGTYGPVTADRVNKMLQLAARHGFEHDLLIATPSM